MKGNLIAVGSLSAALLLWSGTPSYAGHGHGGGGGGSHFSGGPAMGGGHSFSGAGYGGGMRGTGGTFRGYTGGGLGRTYSGYGRGYYYSGGAGAHQTYTGHPARLSGTAARRPSAVPSTGHQINRSQTGINRTNRAVMSSQSRHATINSNTRRVTNESAGNRTITTRDGRNHGGNWARHNPANKNRFDRQTQEKLRNWEGKRSSFAEANERHHGDQGGNHHDGHNHHGGHHGRDWWHHHCNAIILVGGGFWGWWDGWWYPLWGYDPYYYYYAYDGPIYGYDGLPPDEIIANVQSELQRLGYYTYAVDGVLGPLTQEAITRYQRDRLLPITGAVDSATVGSLGLSS